jgi:hypothetical protein
MSPHTAGDDPRRARPQHRIRALRFAQCHRSFGHGVLMLALVVAFVYCLWLLALIIALAR